MDYDKDCVVVRALESNVQVIGMTRGDDTRPHHTEMLDSGEVIVMQFTDKTSMIKIRGNAQILTKHGEVCSERKTK